MAREHPLAGVGPGTFGFNYYSYKLRVEARHPLLLRSGGREWNFGEVHNDHLQTLATAGLPAYALFLCVAVIFARVSLRPVADDDPRRLFARLFALPFTAAMLIVMLAQFPLQLASTLSIGIFAVATSLAWSRQP
jgi:O-antigen ligase